MSTHHSRRSAISLLALGLASTGTLLQGCDSAPSTIKIGVAQPLTGGLAALGQDLLNGVNLAVEELNREGVRVKGKAVRFEVIAVDDRAKVVEVAAHPAGRIPKFDRLGREPIHDRLAQELRAVLSEGDVPAYLDETATDLLAEGRAAFAQLGLATSRFLESGSSTHVLTWRGSAANSVLAVLLSSIGFDCETFDVGVTLTSAAPDDARDVIASLDGCSPIEDLSAFVANLVVEKYDPYVPDDLLRTHWARRNAHLREEVSNLIGELS